MTRSFLVAVLFAATATTAHADPTDTATITGRIVSAGKPVAGAVVVAAYHHGAFAARTDGNGAYTIAGVPTGHHDVFSFASGSYIYDHGGYPDLKAGQNDHSRMLVHVPDTHRAPTVSHLTYAATSAAPGGTIDVAGDWQAHDGTAISDEIFVYVQSSATSIASGSARRRSARTRTAPTSRTLRFRRMPSPGRTPPTSSAPRRRAIRTSSGRRRRSRCAKARACARSRDRVASVTNLLRTRRTSAHRTPRPRARRRRG